MTPPPCGVWLAPPGRIGSLKLDTSSRRRSGQRARASALLGCLALLRDSRPPRVAEIDFIDPVDDPNYEVFVITTAEDCYEDLQYTRTHLDHHGTSTAFSQLYANVKHTEWAQVIDPGDGSGNIYISWAFADSKTVANRLISATKYGEAVTWTVTYGDDTYTLQNTWWFKGKFGSASPDADYDPGYGGVSLDGFADAPTDYSNPSGLAFGGFSTTVDDLDALHGTWNFGSDFWGVGQKSLCEYVFYGDSGGVAKSAHVNRMFVKVSQKSQRLSLSDPHDVERSLLNTCQR